MAIGTLFFKFILIFEVFSDLFTDLHSCDYNRFKTDSRMQSIKHQSSGLGLASARLYVNDNSSTQIDFQTQFFIRVTD